MTSSTMPAPTGRVRRTVGTALRAVPAGVVYDTLGMPMSLMAAQAMTAGVIEVALGRTLAKLHHEPITSVNPKAPIDSIEVVYLVGRFYRELGHKPPDLSKVRRERWSTLEGVADVLHTTVGDFT